MHRTTKLTDLIVILALWLSLSPLLQAQGTIRGVVADANTEVFLDGVRISLGGTDFRTSTDRTGTFLLRNVPAGDYNLVADYIGYPAKSFPVNVQDGMVRRLNLSLGDAGDFVELEAFEVTAVAGGTFRALSRERGAVNNLDIVASDLIGEIPDKSIADAMRRLPGIIVERSQGEGEGRYVIIRGMNADFNSVSVNGTPVTVSNFDGASRSVPLDVIPADSASSIEVSKVIRPDQNADSIGGSIDIRTRSVFERQSPYMNAKAGGFYSALIGDYDDFYLDATGYEARISGGFYLNEDKSLGMAASISLRNSPFLTQSIDTRGYDRVENVEGYPEYTAIDGFYMPTGILLQDFFDEVESLGLDISFEYKPNEDSTYTFSAAYTQRESRRGRQRLELRYDTDTYYWPASYSVSAENDTITDFAANNRTIRQIRDFYENQDFYTLALNGQNIFGDWTLTWQVGYNQGDFSGDPERDLWVEWRTGFSNNFYTLDAPFEPDFGVLDDDDFRDINDPFSYSLNTIDLGTRYITDEEWQVKADLRRDLTLFGQPAFVQAGLQARFRTRDYETVDRFFDNSTTEGGLPDWFLDEAPDGRSPVTASFGNPQTVDNRYSFGFYIDPDRARQVVDSFIASGDLQFSADGLLDSRNRSLSGSYEAEENISSAYLMAQVNFGQWTILSGLRAEHTDVTFDTHVAVINADSIAIEALPVRGKNDYTNLFPSLHVLYEPSDDIIIRSALWTSMARPSYRQLNPAARVDLDELTISRGDTNLDPTYSYNFDLSVDYYLGDAGRLSFGIFYKDMKDNIYQLTSFIPAAEVAGADPADPDYELTEFANADGAQLLGLELGIDLDLDYFVDALRGFNLFANASLADSEVETGLPGRQDLETPLIGQVEATYNIGLEYHRFGFKGRLAYNWRDSYLDFNGLNEDPNLDTFIDSIGTLDLSFSYELPWYNISLYAEFINVTNAPERAYYGDRDLRPRYQEYRDWSAYFGLRWEL